MRKPSNSPSIIESSVPTAPVRSGSGVITDIGSNAITARAEQIRRNTDEGMIWTETPSLALMVPRILLSIIIFCICMLASSIGKQELSGSDGVRVVAIAAQAESVAESSRNTGRKRHQSLPSPQIHSQSQEQVTEVANNLFLLPLFASIMIVIWLMMTFLRLKTTKYAASSQRLIIETGILNTVNRPYEIHTLSNAIIVKPILLRLFGVSNLLIGNPRIALLGLRNSAYVRDILRTGGQLEAQRIDKVRWR